MPPELFESPREFYLAFLQLAVAPLDGLPPLDLLEARILEVVTVAQQNGEHLSVRELIARHELSRPATLHAQLISMRKKNWILISDTKGPRCKRVELTPAALRHLDWLGKCLLAAAKNA